MAQRSEMNRCSGRIAWPMAVLVVLALCVVGFVVAAIAVEPFYDRHLYVKLHTVPTEGVACWIDRTEVASATRIEIDLAEEAKTGATTKDEAAGGEPRVATSPLTVRATWVPEQKLVFEAAQWDELFGQLLPGVECLSVSAGSTQRISGQAPGGIQVDRLQCLLRNPGGSLDTCALFLVAGLAPNTGTGDESSQQLAFAVRADDGTHQSFPETVTGVALSVERGGWLLNEYREEYTINCSFGSGAEFVLPGSAATPK